MVPPSEVTSANGDKVIEGDVKLSRKKPQSVRMQSGASLADVVADAGAHFSAKEKQPINWLSDHLQPHLQYVAALALVL